MIESMADDLYNTIQRKQKYLFLNYIETYLNKYKNTICTPEVKNEVYKFLWKYTPQYNYKFNTSWETDKNDPTRIIMVFKGELK